MADWIADYLDGVESYPVMSLAKPGDVLDQLPVDPPEEGEGFDEIFKNFNDIIIPGMTHWQHPSFFAYFPANSSRISVLAEMLTAALGAQCMIWQTSPAATELEECVMEWLRKMLGLPEGFSGVIQDTASTSTLCSILTARELFTGFSSGSSGMIGKNGPFTTYCSAEAHSSVEKSVKIAGLSSGLLRKIPVDENFAMLPDRLDEAVEKDKRSGYSPLCTVATIGTTSSTAVDPIGKVGEVCSKHKVWFHVDAAFAGSALILPEKRWMIQGIEHVDTFVFNPHKWMFTNFDCSAYFVKDPSLLIRTFEILPEYLKTGVESRVKNFRDWGVPLGRRFRALKLWFVIRHYGVEGLRCKIKKHISMAGELLKKMQKEDGFEVLAPVPLNAICFRYRPRGMENGDELNRLNSTLLEKLNESGELYMTHTKLDGKYTIRMVIGQTEVKERHVEKAWERIKRTAREVGGE